MWKKLSLKSTSLVVHNAPAAFGAFLKEIKSSHTVQTTLRGETDFLLAFVKNKEQLQPVTAYLSGSVGAGDTAVWLAYPKKSSKLSEDLSRDEGFQPLGTVGFEPVSSISIDGDWTALRFRRVEFIKKMARHVAGAMTEAGKERTKDNARSAGAASAAVVVKQAGKSVKTEKAVKRKAEEPVKVDVKDSVAKKRRAK